jgi:hypothetical protein
MIMVMIIEMIEILISLCFDLSPMLINELKLA